MNHRPALRLQREHGSGTVAALSIIAALLLLTLVVHAVSAAAVAKAQTARAADLAALAAADTARGLHSADPCTVAEQVSERNSAVLETCEVGGDHPAEVRVRTSRSFSVAGLPQQLALPELRAASSARAGPPEALAE